MNFLVTVLVAVVLLALWLFVFLPMTGLVGVAAMVVSFFVGCFIGTVASLAGLAVD